MAELKLTTVRKRRKVEIDGAEYEMLDGDELDMASAFEVDALVKAVQEASKGGKKYEDVKDLSRGLGTAVKTILRGVPAEVESKLVDLQRMSIIEAFFKPATEPAVAVADPPAGIPSSICCPGL